MGYAMLSEKPRLNKHTLMHRFDRLLIALLILLLIAMAVTLCFGKGRSRHGYGLGWPALSPQSGSLTG